MKCENAIPLCLSEYKCILNLRANVDMTEHNSMHPKLVYTGESTGLLMADQLLCFSASVRGEELCSGLALSREKTELRVLSHLELSEKELLDICVCIQ